MKKSILALFACLALTLSASFYAAAEEPNPHPGHPHPENAGDPGHQNNNCSCKNIVHQMEHLPKGASSWFKSIEKHTYQNNNCPCIPPKNPKKEPQPETLPGPDAHRPVPPPPIDPRAVHKKPDHNPDMKPEKPVKKPHKEHKVEKRR